MVNYKITHCLTLIFSLSLKLINWFSFFFVWKMSFLEFKKQSLGFFPVNKKVQRANAYCEKFSQLNPGVLALQFRNSVFHEFHE